MNQITFLFSQIRINENVNQSLHELKIIVFNSSPEETRQISKIIEPSILFNSVYSSHNLDALEICGDIVARILQSLKPIEALNEFFNEFILIFNGSDDAVKEFCLKQICKVVEKEVNVSDINVELLRAIVSSVGCVNLGISKAAINILSLLGRDSTFTHSLLNGDLSNVLGDVRSFKDETRFRVYDLIVLLAQISKPNLLEVARCGLLESLAREADRPDPLVQLNSIELLAKFVEGSHISAVNLLKEWGTVSSLEYRLDNIEREPLGALVLPTLLKFFSTVICCNPIKMLPRYPGFMQRLQQCFQNGCDEEQVLAAANLGNISKTVEGKTALSLYNRNLSDNLVVQIGKLCARLSDEKHRARMFEVLGDLVHLKACAQTNELLQLTQHWFTLAMSPHQNNKNFNNSPLAEILKQLALPFVQLRTALFYLLKCLAQQGWACELIRDAPGAVELLLDRSSDYDIDKDLVVAKWQVVHTIVMESAGAGEKLFPWDVWLRLTEHVRQGPFYVRSQSQVAVGSAN